MKTENARTDRAKPIWPSDYSQAGHKKHFPVLSNTPFPLVISIETTPVHPKGIRNK